MGFSSHWGSLPVRWQHETRYSLKTQTRLAVGFGLESALPEGFRIHPANHPTGHWTGEMNSMVPPLSITEIKRFCKAYEVVDPYHTPMSFESKMRLNGFKIDFG